MIAAFAELWRWIRETGTVDDISAAFLRSVEERDAVTAWETYRQGDGDPPPVGGPAGWQPFAVHAEPRCDAYGEPYVYVIVHYRRRAPR